jgi:hypothetical protein
MRSTAKTMLAISTAVSLVLAGCAGTDGAGGASATTVASAPTSSTTPVVITPPTTATTAAPIPPPAGCDETAPSQPPDTALTFYAQCGGSGTVPFPIYRPGRTTPTLQQSVAALLAGTTPAEREIGLYTGFDALDGAAEVDVMGSIDSDGIAHIGLRKDGAEWLPDTSSWSSDQLNSLLDPLLATVFASEDVAGLDMSTLCFEQIACDRTVSRAEWSGILFTNAGALVHDGCTPEFAWWYPDQCTFDGVLELPTGAATVVNVGTDDTLNLRAGPGTEYFVTGELANGTTVQLTQEAAVASDGGIWRLVDSELSGAGWVNQAFLDIPRTATEALADAFVHFAQDPGAGTFAELPLADTVDLGLGPTIVETVAADQLLLPQSWVLEAESFRASIGPFSALDRLRRSTVYDVTVGEHPHCASPPMPAPDGYEDLDRVSIQPRLGLHSSCLMWETVDVFVLPNGDVAAITLDMWEP